MPLGISHINNGSPHTIKGGDVLEENRAEEYFVEGYIRDRLQQKFVVAKSARQACKLFCLEFGLSEAEDVPYLMSTNILDPNDCCRAENNGYLK